MAAIPNRYDVAVRVALPAAKIEELAGQWVTAEPLGPAECRLRMSVDDLNWPLWVLGALAADFTIESPDELRTKVRGAAEILLRNTWVEDCTGSADRRPRGADPPTHGSGRL
jgi:predicted DNA-binding transcriptional regulator YafY